MAARIPLLTRVEPELRDALHVVAERNGRSMSGEVRQLLRVHVAAELADQPAGNGDLIDNPKE